MRASGSAAGRSMAARPTACLGIFEFCPRRPDIVVSGLNGGLNAGINVLYSGTVAAAIEGAFFGITSFAASLEYGEHADVGKAARLASRIIEQVLARKGPEPNLYNLNIPLVALDGPSQVRVVPMGVSRYGEQFIKRTDPRGRTYYWATNDPPPQPEGHETDLTAITHGHITLTPLQYSMTKLSALAEMQGWELSAAAPPLP